MDIVKIFETLKIEATDTRKAVLHRVLAKGENEFTIDEICKGKDSKKLRIGKTAVSGTLRLFVARGLLMQSGVKKAPHRGRPEVLMKIAPKFLST